MWQNLIGFRLMTFVKMKIKENAKTFTEGQNARRTYVFRLSISRFVPDRFALESQCYRETTQNRQLYAHILGEGPPNFGRGGATSFRVGVQMLLRAKRADKFWGLYPHMTFWGYNSCREPIGERFPGICLLQYFLLVMHL